MRFTSKDLMTAMGLKKGDTICITATGLLFSEDIICKVCSDNNSAWLETKDSKISLDSLIGMEFDIIPDILGHALCMDTDCNKCPLRMLDCSDMNGDMMQDKTLYEILDYQNEFYPDKEIYDLVKARLDKH
jgi:hypothetical protein